MQDSELRTLEDELPGLREACAAARWIPVLVFLSGWIVAGVLGCVLCVA